MENEVVVKEEKITNLVKIGDNIEITCDDENIIASEFLVSIKAIQKEVSASFDPIIAKCYQAHKEAKAQKDKYFMPLENIANEVKNKIRVFLNAMEQKRLEQERKLQELARKEEEKQKKLLDERIKKAEEKGNAEKVEALKEQKEAVFVPAPIVQSQVTKVAGTGIVKTWTFEIVDEKLIPREYLLVNEVLLGKVAQAEKGIRSISGVRFYCR